MPDKTRTTKLDLLGPPAGPLDTSAKLSYERTILSHERTLMSWVRTSTSLITFGFTLYKFFALERGTPVPPTARRVLSAREFSTLMIAIGLFALLLAAVQNWQFRTHLRKQNIQVPLSLATLVALLIAGLGLLAMVAVLFRW